MRSKILSLISLILILCVLLSGCNLLGSRLMHYDRMEYTRPDMVAFAVVLQDSCNAALEETDIRKLEDAIWAFYDVYDSFYTNLSLAMIAYSRDLTDIYWEGEYTYCTSQSATADAGLDRLYRSLAKSPLRETLEGEDYFGPDYFDSFEGDSIYDEYMLQLLNREAELCAQYQAVNGEATGTTYYSDEYFSQYGSQMAEIFLELVQLRQEIASYAGYDNYPQFAYDFSHIRDYTPEQAVSYLADIRAELVPLYRGLTVFWDEELSSSSEKETFNYLSSAAKNMGGVMKDAFSDMSEAGVYDITYSENKYATSFEIYLSTYYTPYVFLCPNGTDFDKLSFAHEFGHFCSDYVIPGGSMQGVDVAEIFSQAMEYLSLIYADGGDELTRIKLADSLCTYVEQAALASFEHQVYSLTGEDLTVEGIQTLYEEVCIAYGLDVPQWDSRDYVCVTHFYESPLYIISYVLSNDAALQMYELELEEKGRGLTCFEENLYSAQPYFLAFLEEAGLESPFATGRLIRVRQTLEAALQD